MENQIEIHNNNQTDKKTKKDYWDIIKIIVYCFSALFIPILSIYLMTKGNEFQNLYKKKEYNLKMYEIFLAQYPKLISKDPIERQAARIVLEELRKEKPDINFVNIQLDMLAFTDPVNAVKTFTKIIKDKNSNSSIKMKAEMKLKEIEKNTKIVIIKIPKIPNGSEISTYLEDIEQIWYLTVTNINVIALNNFNKNFKSITFNQGILTLNKDKDRMELRIDNPWKCINIDYSIELSSTILKITLINNL